MRRHKALALIQASGWTAFEPTDEQRELVRLLEFNGTPHARIAQGLSLSVEELRYHFADELGYAKDRLLASLAKRMLYLSAQERDLGVALKATELALRTRLPAWREPDPRSPPEASSANIPKLSLSEVESALHGLGPDSAASESPVPPAAEGESG